MQDSNTNGIGASALVDRYLPPADAGGQGIGRSSYPPTLFNLSMLRAILWRQRFVLAGIVSLALIAGLVATLMATPLYRAEAKLRVDSSTMNIVEGQELIDPYMPHTMMNEVLRTMKEVIESRNMALRVVDALSLHENPEFIGDLARDKSARTETQRRNAAADVLRAGVLADLPPQAQIITISYTSPDPQIAARIANAYAETFMLDDINQSIEANAYARSYLEEQIDQVRKQLQEAENEAIAYARNNRIIGQPLASDSSSGGSSQGSIGTAPTLTAANLIEVNRQLTEARAARIAAEERWRAVANVPATQIAEVQQNSAIQALRTQLTDRSTRLAELRERYRNDYPPVRELQSEVQSLTQAINTMSAEVKAAIRSQYEIARGQEARLTQELARVSDASLAEQDRRVEFNQIDRRVVSLQTQLASLLDRYNQISAASNLRSSKIGLIDSATVPGAPFSPNLPRNMLIALVLGLAIAGMVAILREILDDKLRAVEDIESKLMLPALGQTPYTPDETAAELNNRFSPLSEAYASIRASLDYRLGKGEKLVVQLTSTQPGEGKSTSSAALSAKYAAVGRKVLLVDMDLRRPSIAGMFDRPRTSVGVLDVLHGRVALEKAIFRHEPTNLDILPVGEIPAYPVEVLSSGLVPEFLEVAKARYDVIVIDSSPILGIADAPLLSRFVDAVVLVVEANRANARETRSTIRRLQDVNANIVGAILTKFRALEAGQAYNYQYRYYTYSKQD